MSEMLQTPGSLNDVWVTCYYRFGCGLQRTFYFDLVFETVAPICMCALVFAFVLFSKATLGASSGNTEPHDAAERLAKRVTACYSAIFLIIFFVFPSVSNKVFRTFACERFDDGEEFLRADLSLDCGAPLHATMFYYGIVTLFVYPLGVPLLFWALLWRHRAQFAQVPLAVYIMPATPLESRTCDSV